MQRAEVEVKYQIKTLPSIDAAQMQYFNEFTILDDETTLELIERIKDRVHQHARTYHAQTIRIREIQIAITY